MRFAYNTIMTAASEPPFLPDATSMVWSPPHHTNNGNIVHQFHFDFLFQVAVLANAPTPEDPPSVLSPHHFIFRPSATL